MTKTLLPLLAVLSFVGAGQLALTEAARAQVQSNSLPAPGMLPDNPFYFLKSASESVGTLLTFGGLADAKRSLDLAEMRLAEARALVIKGEPAMVGQTVTRYEEQLERALEKAEKANAKGVDTDQLLARASVATLKHQAVLAEVYERVPEAARPGIERAMQASMRGHEGAMSGISGEKRDQVMAGVNKERRKAGPKLDELRSRGIPIPAVRSRREVERGKPARPRREESETP